MSQKLCNFILFGNSFTQNLMSYWNYSIHFGLWNCIRIIGLLLGVFSQQIKINLFADFHNGTEISEIFVGIPIKEFIFLSQLYCE